MGVDDLVVASDGCALLITFGDGRRRSLSADLLWRECPSAQGRVRRAQGHNRSPRDLKITAAREIGTYGVNIAFSDGHDRGIYPWSYLEALAARPQLEDFLYA